MRNAMFIRVSRTSDRRLRPIALSDFAEPSALSSASGDGADRGPRIAQGASSAAMRVLATGHTLFGLPNALLVWAAVGGAAVFLLTRMTFGRAIYGIGNRERAAYLSGVRTQRVVLVAFAIAGGLSAFGGVLLAGYASKAAQAIGDAYLLASIAAVVLGGASILGGRGSYIGTVAGVILITPQQSILPVIQIQEAERQVIYGVVIIAMLLLYGRERLAR